MQISFPQKSHFGVLTATEVRTPLVNNPAGDLLFHRMGVLGARLEAARFYTANHLKLGTNKSLMDISDTVLIGSDNLGHIDQLGRIDTEMSIDGTLGKITSTTWGVANEISCAAMLVKNGTVSATGIVESNASETIILDISMLRPYKLHGAFVRLERFTLNYETTHIDTYITSVTVKYIDNDGTITLIQAWPGDLGNGSTGWNNETFDLTTPATTVRAIIIEVVTVIATGIVKLNTMSVLCDTV